MSGLCKGCRQVGSVCRADWSVVDPMEYLGPFLEVIRSPETSGPITGMALTSLCRMLDNFIMGKAFSRNSFRLGHVVLARICYRMMVEPGPAH